MAALAVASTVASMIAANNAGDGGIGALLEANYKTLQEAVKKLDDIQSRLSEIYEKLEALPDEIDRLLRQETTRKLQVELMAVVRGYGEKLNARDPAQTDQQWRRDPVTQRDIANLLFRLQKARQEVNVQNLLDPSTALVATSLGYVEANLQNILGYRRYEIASTISTIYLPWLEAILDPNITNSTAGYTLAANNRLAALMSAAAINPVGASVGFRAGEQGTSVTLSPVEQSLLACVGINDYRPKKTDFDDMGDCINPKYTSVPAPGANSVASTGPDDPSGNSLTFLKNGHQLSTPEVMRLFGRTSSNFPPLGSLLTDPQVLANSDVEIAFSCNRVRGRVTSERIGAKDRLMSNVSLKEGELIEAGQPTGVLMLSLSKSEEQRGTAGGSGMVSDTSCELQTQDMVDANDRLSRMRAMGRWAEAEKNYSDLSLLVDQINLERGRIAYGGRAMLACEVTRQSLTKLVDDYA